ncbi:uncharacterized protein N7498_003744 [Penicillium cinerascens]|uniref:Cytochrome P450 n=1 Tax=Penicillium cinerascens TaxID=70096 RepID=A0A9W9N2R9_9EURO|nr:uncharacterized protein N7498_003744 [Penicillium cinerascens]KAJ5212098.1 hypothetical protein N7498_003744 [Penicillium cinerascens]
MTLVVCFLLGSVLAYGLVSLVYRLHVHPLSKFPGPRLAAVTGLYEIYFSVWGLSSFDDEIERMHQEYGPVVRITPDEIHVLDQLYNTNYVNRWVKGSQSLDSGSHQSGRISMSFQIRKRSMSRVRSILQVEIHQIIRGLVRKHHVHKLFSSSMRPFPPTLSPLMIRVDPPRGSDLEDGPQSARSFPRPRLFGVAEGNVGPWKPKVNEQGLSAMRSGHVADCRFE